MKPSEQLALAQHEEAPETVLLDLWNTSRSVKVRKAVARNPNAGPQVLRKAARLYLEDVLENPGFSMLELFDEDVWIKSISEAYADPEGFINKSARNVASVHQIAWACLLSPRLTSIAIDNVIRYASGATLKRAIKNEVVLNNIRSLYLNSLTSLWVWPFDLETLLILYREDIISSEELYSGLSNYGATSTSAKKSTIKKFTNQVLRKYISTKESSIAKLLAKFILVVRHYALSWVLKSEVMYSQFHQTGSLFAEVLSYMTSSYGPGFRSKKNFAVVCDLVSRQIRYKFFGNEFGSSLNNHEYLSDQINQAYDFIKSHGILSVYPSSGEGLQLGGKSAINALTHCREEVKEFFIKRGCVGSWVSTLSSDPKYILINGVNEAIFLREGISDNLLFKCCSLSKIISFNGSTHVL